jgi:N-acetylglucosaminyl-diphospho-decaprenol L-rhamnosyltransferase
MEAVIVTYNSARALEAMLQSDSTRSAFSRIIVVDNDSRDETREVAYKAGVEVVRLSKNHGFGVAANAGVAETTGELIALLNPDVEIEQSGAMDRLAAQFADDRVAIVAPALRLPGGQIQDSARTVPTPVNLVRRRFVHRRAGALWSVGAVDAGWVVGAAMIIRRTSFQLVGGFDNRYLVYFEDVDLCVRMRRAGYSVRFDPGVVLAHQHAASSRQSMRNWTTRQHMRSALLFYRRFPRYLLSARG